jgi:hypothetical protein
MTIAYIRNILEFPQEELPPPYTDTPEAYSERQWILSARQDRREMSEGLQTGRYYPTPEFMAALERLESMLEEVKHIK